MLSHSDEILRSCIAAVDRHPKIPASDNLTYSQLLDHLPELCAELAALLKQPDAKDVKRKARGDARAHGGKRWRQGYKLDELIREICLVRRDFIDTWLRAFSAANPDFDVDAQNGARRVVEAFFDNVIIEATVQFVQERQQTLRDLKVQLREPLGPLLMAVQVMMYEEHLSPLGWEMIPALERCIKEESRRIDALLSFAESV